MHRELKNAQRWDNHLLTSTNTSAVAAPGRASRAVIGTLVSVAVAACITVTER